LILIIERPKSKMGGFSSVFRTLGRGSGKKEKTPSTSTPAGPIHGTIILIKQKFAI
jgi:hypothetical protein